MDGEAADIADIGYVVEEFERFNKFAPCLQATLELEADQTTKTAREIFLRPLAIETALLRWMNHLGDLRPFGQELGNLLRILDVALQT